MSNASAQETDFTISQAELDSASMALGINVGQSLVGYGIDSLNYDAFVEGLKKALSNQLDQGEVEACQKTINDYVQKLAESINLEKKQAGLDYLTQNGAKEGVVTLPSGLQYKVITKGTGPTAVDGDRVTTHYTGKLIDGSVFDSSVERGQPATFGVNQVIKGWTEALKLMPEGSKWELTIPYELAYGATGNQRIPGYSTLIFEVEVIDVIGK
jgi:FKBP-type peptidyl-prolyl cis-trans isomerase FklB